MLVAYAPYNIKHKDIREACLHCNAQYEKHLEIDRIFRFTAQNEEDLKFLISRLHLKPI
jgi:hypothetical protein